MKKPRLLLVGWDAADWKIINPLIERGEMPTLARFLDQGVMGDMTTLEPILSPMLWNSIATGKRADKHGILGFTEVDPERGHVRPVTSTSRKVKAVWNILSQSGYRSNVVNWFGGHPAEPINGVVVSEAFTRALPNEGQAWPMPKHSVHPAALADKLADLRVRPDEIGEEIILTFCPRAREVDQTKDRRLGVLMKLIAECFTTHAAATWLMQNEPWDFSAIYYGAIDHFSHGFMRLHPPRRRGVDETAFGIYGDVVNGAYRLHDMMFRTLLALAGEETTVILLSDHGFHSDHLRPRFIPGIPTGPAVEHRPIGILAMRGPNVRRDERIYGANLLDITPTLLSIFNLPIGQDMDGRVLVEAFDTPPAINTIESWEKQRGASGMHQANICIDPDEASALLEQFVALGYIDPPSADKEQAARDCRAENDWNLARVLMDAERFFDALPLLEKIHEDLPERPDIAFALARTLLRLGLYKEAEETLRLGLTNSRQTPALHWLLAEVSFRRGDYADSLTHLRTAQKAQPRSPELFAQIGQTLLRLRKWNEAEESFRRSIRINPQYGAAHLGLAVALTQQRRHLESAEAALDAVSYSHPQPLGHFYLGVALARLGEDERAALAMERALHLNPGLAVAHRSLVRIYLRLGDKEKAEVHRQQLEQVVAVNQQQRDKLARVRREAAVRSRARRGRVAALRAAKAEERAQQKKAERAQRRSRNTEKSVPRLDLLIVSGLPRSGTSLMMQMLAAGGVPILTDGKREADLDNPEGYFEWEPIKKLPQRPELIRQAKGKAVKVVSALLPALPRRHRYRIIFMDRAIDQVVASQSRMIARRTGQQGSGPATGEMLQRHRTLIREHLETLENVTVLRVSYAELVAAPDSLISAIAEFVGPELLPNPELMRNAIRPRLYRNTAAALADAAH